MGTTKMASLSSDPEIDEIRRRMSLIRRDMHGDVQMAVNSAQRWFDWKSYVTNYPWIAVAVAVGAGFIVAPARRRAPDLPLEPSTLMSPAPEQNAGPPRPAPRWHIPRSDWVGLAIGILGPIAVRVAQNYSIHTIQRWIESQSEATRSRARRLEQETIHDESRSGLASGARGARPH